MQKIDNIEIKNFKSVRHQKIEGCKRINVFIGYPNVGKSNILEALSAFSFIQGGSELNLNSIFRLEKFPELFFNGNTDSPIEISLNRQQILKIRANGSPTELDFSCYEISNEDSVEHEIYRGSVGGGKDWTTGNSQNLIREIFWFGVKKYNFLYSSHGKEKVTSNFLSFPSGQNLYEVLGANKHLKSEITNLFKDYDLNLVFDHAGKELKILKRISDTDIFLLPYHQIADTLQRLIFYKTAILSNKDSILLFEEPESHTFPPYISKFTSDMVHDENHNQFFLTTHSPFVLNDLMDNLKSDELAIYIVNYKKETGETLIHRMSEEDMHEAYQFGYDFFMNIDKFISQEQHDEI